ncbi:MAG: helix-turn-helix transcriptional regulator [candidate division WOR-3 bacterium]
MTSSKTENTFFIELGKLLKEVRNQANLTQSELAKRLGLSATSGFTYISQLETGKIKNPSLMLILRYLKICQIPWPSFFQKLSRIDFKIEHEEIMSQVEMPSSLTSGKRQKIDRDTALYLTKVQYPKTPYQKLDWQRIKEKVDKKVKELLCNHQLDEEQKRPYLAFVKELIDNYDTPQSKIIFEKYYRSQKLNWRIVSEIRSIIYKIVRYEQRRLAKPKPLPQEKIKKMAKEFLKYRTEIEPIEDRVQKKVSELSVPTVYNQAYKDFARECFSVLKKFYPKDPKQLTEQLERITKTWEQKGLNVEVMDIVKQIVLEMK